MLFVLCTANLLVDILQDGLRGGRGRGEEEEEKEEEEKEEEEEEEGGRRKRWDRKRYVRTGCESINVKTKTAPKVGLGDTVNYMLRLLLILSLFFRGVQMTSISKSLSQ